MRCHICDKPLTEKEVKYDHDHQEWSPCGTCLQAIQEVFDDSPEDEEWREVDENDLLPCQEE